MFTALFVLLGRVRLRVEVLGIVLASHINLPRVVKDSGGMILGPQGVTEATFTS